VAVASVDWRRYAAPAAFLLAVTVAVVLVRSGLRHDPANRTASTPTVATTRAPPPPFWTVRAGDTFGVISQKTGVPVATIQKLNPRASSTSLFIGEKIRLK
jgi:LysM repeat protein